MKIKVTIAFLFFGFLTYAQRNSRDIPSVDLIYGFKTLNKAPFGTNIGKQYSSFSHFRWSSPLRFIGAGMTLLGDSVNGGGKYFIGNAQIWAYLPQRISITDSMTVKSKGFNIGITFLGIDAFPQNKHLDLILNIGFDAGRILLSDQGIHQRNLYFSPKLSLQPKVKIGPIALSLCGEYGYDLTKDRWKKTWFGPAHQNTLLPYSGKIGGFSGLSWFVTLGYTLN